MMANLTQAFADWIAEGGREVGEIHIEPGEGGYWLCHREEVKEAPGGQLLEGPEAARELAHFDDAGKFRPLKTAPTLRHGWKLRVANLAELRRALDYFYPAMVGVWASHRRGSLTVAPLRETLGRQSGMYAVTKKITDAQAQEMIGGFCRTTGGCLKRILWPLSPGVPVTSLPAEKFVAEAGRETLPLLCHEACNLLVAKAREVVKKAEASA
jgi:sirohydrochlorin cobaltochelatase